MHLPNSETTTTRTYQPTERHRQAFTLIELLVVIVIIGILTSLVTAGVVTARRRMVDGALKLQATNLELAMEAYRDKYGDYPPDFSDWSTVERHFRTAYPRISPSDLNLLKAACFVDIADTATFQQNGVDRSEALVFALGGYSSDARFPFTGSGGPFVLIPGTTAPADLASYHYNTSRDNRLYEFDETRLTMAIYSDSNGNTVGYSTDESTYWNTGSTSTANGVAPKRASAPSNTVADLFPAYKRTSDPGSLPFVYFDSRTYSLGTTTRTVNSYQPTAAAAGVAKPYKSLVVNTGGTGGVTDNGLFYVNRDKFQIISAGQDEDFGGATASPALAYIYPTGAGFNVNTGTVAGISRYHVSGSSTNGQEDNVTNFSSTTLESDLE